MKTKILLLGNTGQVGWELNRTLITLGDLVAIDFPQINMADENNIRSVAEQYQPDIIINATAYTDVDKAESEQDLALAINGTGPGTLAEIIEKQNAFLIHYSTDYIFNGEKNGFYIEEDQPSPINAYGRTKLAGELEIKEKTKSFLIFRTSWVYSNRRPCFVSKVLQWAKENEILNIVEDQISSPTSSRTLAEITAQIIAQGKDDPLNYLKGYAGIYHLTDKGPCSRYEWAKAIIGIQSDTQRLKVKHINPVKSSYFSTPANRPLRSVLSCEKLEQTFKVSLPEWHKTLELACGEI